LLAASLTSLKKKKKKRRKKVAVEYENVKVVFICKIRRHTFAACLNSIRTDGILRKIPKMKHLPANSLNQNANGTI
jgi:hypothetical protein